MQPNLTWKWIAAAAVMLVFGALIFLPIHGASHAAVALDTYYGHTAYDVNDPEVQAAKQSPFPEKPSRSRARQAETPLPDNTLR